MNKNQGSAATASLASNKNLFFKRLGQNKTLLLMCLPAVLFFIIFHYVPLPGVWVAFVKYNYRDGIFGSRFIGLDNFKFLFTSGKLWLLTRNTVLYNISFIVLGNMFAIFIAILINEIRSRLFKKISQTMMFLPYFISAVLVGLLVYNILNYDYGFLNTVLVGFGAERWAPYSDPNAWPFLIVIIHLWQTSGYNSIIYFASIMGIHGEILEAAKVDGANAFQRIWYIILPSLKPTVAILLLFAIGGIVKGNFGLFYNIIGRNSMLYPTTDIIETYVYRATINDFNFSTASAVGLYQSIFGFLLVLACNATVKKIEPEYSLF